MKKHIEVTQEAGTEFYKAFHNKGPVVMLNLLKFNAVADYSKYPELQPKEEITGLAAYKLYEKYTIPLLEIAGSRVLFYGKSQSFLIGPESEQWDAVLMVEHQSVAKFMEFAQDKTYLKTFGHRNAALEDSRLLPISAFDLGA